ncbi:MAG TPA: transporter substrate-binding domain-containing protein, partial [Ilumatobacter sp.]
MRTRTTRLTLAIAVLALVGTACTSDDDEADDTAASAPGTGGEQPADTQAPDGTTAATDAATDAADETTPGDEVQTGESLLDTVQANGVVRCGTRDALPGFSVLTPDGDHVGFDADFCRVIAAAVLGDSTKVEFVDVETDARFTALQSGEFDVLVRNTTWTASRDGI